MIAYDLCFELQFNNLLDTFNICSISNALFNVNHSAVSVRLNLVHGSEFLWVCFEFILMIVYHFKYYYILKANYVKSYLPLFLNLSKKFCYCWVFVFIKWAAAMIAKIWEYYKVIYKLFITLKIVRETKNFKCKLHWTFYFLNR